MMELRKMKDFLTYRTVLVALSALATTLVASGCITTYADQRAEEETQAREDSLLMQENLRKMDGRIEALELEVDRLQKALDASRNQQSTASQAQLQSVQASVADLDQRLRSLDAKNEREKQEIIDRLSAKVAQLVGGSSGGSRPKPSAPKKPVSGEGYEHVVQAGETLSAIAAAYNVRSADIIDANNLQNPNQLKAGQKLFIPAP